MPDCLVCGYPSLEEPPRAPSGGGSYEICPSCGFQFGVDDDDRGLTYEQARQIWIEKGMPWYSKSRKAPSDWNALQQLRQVHGESSKKKMSAWSDPLKTEKKQQSSIKQKRVVESDSQTSVTEKNKSTSARKDKDAKKKK